MESVSSSSLRRRRRQLVKALPPIEQIVRGSLMETYKRCGRAGCHCVDGPGHGPKRYLSTIARTGERPRLGYVPNAIYPKVAEFLGNYRTLQEMLNEICAINVELLAVARVSTKWTRLLQPSILRQSGQRILHRG